MDLYTELTKAWLDRRYRDSSGLEPGLYFAHEPIYGVGANESEPNHANRLVRLLQLLRKIRQAGGETLLDVGGSEGFLSQLCRELFGMKVVSVDLSAEACRRAAEIFGIPTCAVDAGVLPFASGAFDVVVCAEVVEHLAEPVPSILELQRVCSGSLVLSTEDWEASAERRDAELSERKLETHGDRSIFADADLKPLFAPYQVSLERQELLDHARFGDDRRLDLAALRAALLAVGKVPPPSVQGVVLAVTKSATKKRTPKVPSDEEILDHLLRRRMPVHRIPETTPVIAWPRGLARHCVLCGKEARADGDDLACACGERYSCERGVISMQRSIQPFATRVDAMLRERGGPGYPDQRKDLLALAAKLELEFAVTTAWDFRTAAAETWEQNEQIERQSDGSYRVDGEDPWLESPLVGVPAASAARVVVEFAAKANGPAGRQSTADVFWMEEGDAWFSATKRASVAVPLDGVVRKHVFVAPQLDGRRLMKLRFDPVSGERATVVVRSISLA